jgi:phospholipid-transporting ATPase
MPFFWLLLNIIRREFGCFYSIYFILLAILEGVEKDLASESMVWILIPLLFMPIISFLIDGYNLFRAQWAARAFAQSKYNVIRDHEQKEVRAKDIRPGDLLDLVGPMTIPCDCVILRSSQGELLFATGASSGESAVQARAPVAGLDPDLRLMGENMIVDAPAPPRPPGDVSGVIHIGADIRIRDGERVSALVRLVKYRDEPEVVRMLDRAPPIPFSRQHFVQRGAELISGGQHMLVAVYTGTDCGDDGHEIYTRYRRTAVDKYLDKLALLCFVLQLVMALASGISRSTKVWSWQTVILCTQNYLLFTQMLPITLKLSLPIFRFFYGRFVQGDPNFRATDGGGAKVFASDVIETLGGVSLVLCDKEGCLTRGELSVARLALGARVLTGAQLRAEAEAGAAEAVLAVQALALCNSVFERDDRIFATSGDDIAIYRFMGELGLEVTRPDSRTVVLKLPGAFEIVFSILEAQPWSVERGRQSVVVRSGDGSLLCFMKGQSAVIGSRCADGAAADPRTFEVDGLRASSFSFRRLNDAEVHGDVERGHTLLGVIGVDDAPQQDIAVSIDVLRKAGIRLWVASPDSQLTTLAAGRRAGLITDAPILVLREGFWRAVSGLQAYSVIADCGDHHTLGLLSDPSCRMALLNAEAVFFAGAGPADKAQIATELQTAGETVLGVGGHRDRELLRTADVGVAIGVTQNRRADVQCDFALPSFRLICRLVLVHGHLSLHRSILLVHYSFYKGCLITFLQALYQIWTGGTGQSFFDDFSISTYNVVWTLLPMLAIFFERDLENNFLLRLSHLYNLMRNNLSVLGNISWLVVAAYQAGVMMAIAWALTGEAFVDAETGIDLGQGYLSLLVYIAVIISVECFLVFNLNVLTYYSIVALVGNIVLMVAAMSVMQSHGFMGWMQWLGFYGECFGSPQALILLTTMSLAAVLPSWAWIAFWSVWRMGDVQQVLEAETLKARNAEVILYDPPRAKR